MSSTNKQTQIAEYYALDPDKGLTGGESASAVWVKGDQGDAVQEYPGRSVRDPVCAV